MRVYLLAFLFKLAANGLTRHLLKHMFVAIQTLSHLGDDTDTFWGFEQQVLLTSQGAYAVK